LGAIVLIGCSAGQSPIPEPDLGRDVAAQRNLQRIRDAWDKADHDARAALETSLSRHVARYTEDPSARVARSMLAILALEKGDADRARMLARSIEEGPHGGTRDVASVVLGAIDRRSGRAAEALERLAPLFNKVIDPVARTLLNRELCHAAIETKKHDRAAIFLQAYLRQATAEELPFVEIEAAALISKLPPRVAFALLVREHAGGEPNPRLLSLLGKHLGDVVLRDEDVGLAKDLLDVAGQLLGNRADSVARIAARGASVRLERNTVGLVLPLRSEELSRRGVEVAAGLAAALGIPGGKARLVTRDDQRDLSSIDQAFALLNADGAAVIVAGFDVKEADAARAYSERTGVPVILLREPSRPVAADGPVFVLGEAPSAPRTALVRALIARGSTKVALYVGDRDGADATVAEAGVVGVQACGASLDFVKTSGATSLVIDGGPACAVEAVEAAPAQVTLAFGLDASSAQRPGLHASAGIFPLRGAATDDPDLVAFRASKGADPTWWNALGHDAGVLVKDAVLSLPQTAEQEDAAASAQRMQAVAREIAAAAARLWTTDATGFAGKRTIARTISVADRGSKPAPGERAKPKR
jgi:hypothetical protein